MNSGWLRAARQARWLASASLAVAVREGREAWRAESCCAVPGLSAEQACGRGPGCTGTCQAGHN